VDIADVDTTTWDLSVKNPNKNDEVVHRSPIEILDEIAALDAETTQILDRIRALL
jgi:type I restriction enzyme M protein